jgi:hypothetical protein
VVSGKGVESVATITAWNPPQYVTAKPEEGPVTAATDWIVEATTQGRLSQSAYFFRVSRNGGVSARVKTMTSSPLITLMS